MGEQERVIRSSAIDLRPTKWEDVIGQDSVVSSIRNKLKTGVPPAFLFSGPSGSGKSTLAEILAREVQKEGTDPEFLDIRRIPAADKNGVDDIRELAEEAKYFAGFGKYRVIILDEAHMLTNAAQNALLIPTEQLPGQETTTIWILCTTEPQKIIPTLKSRCLSYQLKAFDEKEIASLVIRAVQAGVQSTSYPDGYANHFIDEVVRVGLSNPREILYAFDKYVSGVPLDEAINLPPESNVAYTDIAKMAVHGDWTGASVALKLLKTADVKGLKSVLSWFFRTSLLDLPVGIRADAMTEALIRLGNLTSFEDGVTYGAITGIIYTYCKKVKDV